MPPLYLHAFRLIGLRHFIDAVIHASAVADATCHIRYVSRHVFCH